MKVIVNYIGEGKGLTSFAVDNDYVTIRASLASVSVGQSKALKGKKRVTAVFDVEASQATPLLLLKDCVCAHVARNVRRMDGLCDDYPVEVAASQ